MTEHEAYRTVCHPIPNYRPRPSLSLRAFLTIAALVMVAVGLWAVN